MADNNNETPLQQPEGGDDQGSVRDHGLCTSCYRYIQFQRQLYAEWVGVDLDENNNEIPLEQLEGADANIIHVRDNPGLCSHCYRFLQIQERFCAQLRSMLENADNHSSDSD